MVSEAEQWDAGDLKTLVEAGANLEGVSTEPGEEGKSSLIPVLLQLSVFSETQVEVKVKVASFYH